MYQLAKDNIRIGIVGYRDLHLRGHFQPLPFQPVTKDGIANIKQYFQALDFTTVLEEIEGISDFPEVRQDMYIAVCE